MDKENLILDDFYKTNCVETVFDGDIFFGGEYVEKEYEPNETILKLYEDCPGRYRIIFATFHDRLNSLLGFMNAKISSNRHYNANESRGLLNAIRNIFSLRSELSKIGVSIEIDEKYDRKMAECLNFLQESYGSEIPEAVGYFEITKYNPIFRIKDIINKTRLEKARVKFNNIYQIEQSKKLLDFVEDDQVLAIGSAKEYIEACLQTILDGKIDRDVDKMEVNELMSETKKYFKLNSSSIKEVTKIISGLSQVSNGICELRNHKGSGHSHNKYSPPSKREAQLAVDAAITIVNFYWSLYEGERGKNEPDSGK